jgi:hypothetical protein
MFSTIMAVLNALAAIPKILGFVESFASAVAIWWCQRQTGNTLSAIADAAALASRAKNDEERMAAAMAWRDALSRPRITP